MSLGTRPSVGRLIDSAGPGRTSGHNLPTYKGFSNDDPHSDRQQRIEQRAALRLRHWARVAGRRQVVLLERERRCSACRLPRLQPRRAAAARYTDQRASPMVIAVALWSVNRPDEPLPTQDHPWFDGLWSHVWAVYHALGGKLL